MQHNWANLQTDNERKQQIISSLSALLPLKDRFSGTPAAAIAYQSSTKSVRMDKIQQNFSVNQASLQMWRWKMYDPWHTVYNAKGVGGGKACNDGVCTCSLRDSKRLTWKNGIFSHVASHLYALRSSAWKRKRKPAASEQHHLWKFGLCWLIAGTSKLDWWWLSKIEKIIDFAPAICRSRKAIVKATMFVRVDLMYCCLCYCWHLSIEMGLDFYPLQWRRSNSKELVLCLQNILL